MVFNWLIGGSDAHAKNYSLLLASGPLVRLAPLYDIASILPYDNVDQRKIKLAMKVGGEYKLDQIGLRQWQKFSRELRVDADVLIATLISMAGQIHDLVADIRTRAQKEGLENAVIERLATALGVGAKDCEHVLKGPRIRIIHQLKESNATTSSFILISARSPNGCLTSPLPRPLMLVPSYGLQALGRRSTLQVETSEPLPV
ncbi:hypothetical protein ACVWW6_000287 [Bradyrhizobium sp. USDA 3311]